MEDLNLQKQRKDLKQFLDTRIKEYTDASSRLQKQYLKDQQEGCQDIHHQIKLICAEIRNTINILDEVIKFPAHLRLEIVNTNDMSTQEIIEKKMQLQKLLTKYQKTNIKQSVLQKSNTQTRNDVFQSYGESQKSLDDVQLITTKSEPKTNKTFGILLLVLESTSYILGLLTIIVYIYNLAFT